MIINQQVNYIKCLNLIYFKTIHNMFINKIINNILLTKTYNIYIKNKKIKKKRNPINCF